MKTASEIRQEFLDFFKSKGHVIVPSAPIVVKNDPTLLFINSGMAPFKDAFLGNKPAPAKRVADTQKCLRVSGKHNDLEEVGVDTYHHTMFEMLGNWSFGDYFKKEAIAWSWELLTDVYGIPEEQLYVTVFGGDEKEGLAMDQEAYDFWKEHIDESRILQGSKKDNFWEMGDTGPCGPCSEIHVDCRTAEERADGKGHELVNADHPQVIEIWNNVFMQFNRKKDGSLELLPAQHVDTGMGFERLVRVLQKKTSNYDTDVFSNTITAVEKITGKKYDASLTPADSIKVAGSSPLGGGWEGAVAFRVLADHIRAIAFTIADGQLPSNTGAGYVIRRILRRAVRYYYSYLDYKQPLMFQLLPVIAEQFKNVFPELAQQQDFVAKVIKEEEEGFLRTLDKGLKRMDAIIASAKDNTISGSDAFELLDTYGFPIDLTHLIASENDLRVDEAGFHAEMKQQKDRSRAATALDTEDWVVVNEGNSNGFVGYEKLEADTKVLRYRKVSGKGKTQYQIVLDQTPFYAESGGQVGDTGKFLINNEELIINNTKKENDLIIHFTDSIPESLEGNLTAYVDIWRRKNIAVHHSVTHLMHAALRQVLGTHVAQKGSLVNDEYLRFDFSHFVKMTEEEIAQVEKIVNEKIRENIPVVIKSMSKDEAIAMGATALFGEKYGDVVRVVVMDPAYSIELCGGTHVGSTGELGYFKITSEAAVAAGVRRIEAVSGAAAENFIKEELGKLEIVKKALKNPKEFNEVFEKFISEKNDLKKKIDFIEMSKSTEIATEILAENVVKHKIISVIASDFDCYSVEIFNSVFNNIRNKIKDSVIILGAKIQNKEYLRVFINTKDINYTMNFRLDSIYNDIVVNDLTSTTFGQIAEASANILNAVGNFKNGLKQIIKQVETSITSTISAVEMLDDFTRG
ncbi:alanine--tRNA ligase [Ferruginibacter sp. HRS2-29]|uniref:alanine--tRNA ligase n=1 Tax=Ferruginibacter sp. HRS2-29 TaxID=2487334 RepID=UPI0020CE3DB1|nr:alanine--tRNA ligase [Ferruginibacter sp. HRS2-29]MCP9752859.1 alanine--tRNA ligase [Ferruginibacter sp. HRS2-29]